MDERPLAERLITYDTSTPDGLRAAAGFVKGWLQSHDIDAWDRDHAPSSSRPGSKATA